MPAFSLYRYLNSLRTTSVLELPLLGIFSWRLPQRISLRFQTFGLSFVSTAMSETSTCLLQYLPSPFVALFTSQFPFRSITSLPLKTPYNAFPTLFCQPNSQPPTHDPYSFSGARPSPSFLLPISPQQLRAEGTSPLHPING